MNLGAFRNSSEDNDYIKSMAHSAWTYTFCHNWANTKMVSLSRIQQHIQRETHVPVTLDMLLQADLHVTKYQKRPWWSDVESTLRCVTRYHHAFCASEYESCALIQRYIRAYSLTLRRGLHSNVDVTEFLTLLHCGITNRALYEALQTTIDQARDEYLPVGPGGLTVSEDGRRVLADLLEQCLDIVDQDYQKIRTDMRQFRC